MDQIKQVFTVTTKVVNKLSKGKPISVFGAAPSLSQMLKMNKMNKEKVLFRCPYFWYYFRVYYPFTFPMIFFIFMITSLTAMNSIEGSLVMGSILSLIGGASVLGSYMMIKPWQKHPSILVVYRTLTNMLFSIVIILEAISTNKYSCRNYAVATHYLLLASESWLTTIASDLVHSLTNPFASYKANLRRYHLLVWLFSSFVSFILYLDEGCQGQFDQGICWVKVSSTNTPCLWGYYLFWIVCMYGYQVWSFIFAYLRLKRGLPITFEVRQKCAEETFKCLASYAVYLSILVFIFVVISSDPSPAAGTPMANFSLFFLFIIANRGSVDSIIWFMLHDFIRDEDEVVPQVEMAVELAPMPTDVKPESNVGKTHLKHHLSSSNVYEHLEAGELDDSEENQQRRRSLLKLEKAPAQIKESVTKAVTEIADLAIAEFDESDLSPQVNLALRQQIVSYVTKGVQHSILSSGAADVMTPINTSSTSEPSVDARRASIASNVANIKASTTKHKASSIDSWMERIMYFQPKDPAVTPGLQVQKFYLDGEYPFKSFGDDVFSVIRENEGISDEKFLDVLSKPTNERLSEGASGAFMFFCGDHGEFIVKTIRAREAKVLHNSLNEYSNYLQQNRNSFLCRFIGSYSLRIYDQTFYFVIMMNIFPPHAKINERYDIKGSWVGRSAEPTSVTSSKRIVCRHCNSYFMPSQQEKCSVIVGLHEANVVLKDNDLRSKVAIDNVEMVKDILEKDSELLGRLGVIDYSLLIGVLKCKFTLNVTDEMMSSNADTKNIRLTASVNSLSDSVQKSSSKSTNSHRVSSFKATSITGPAVYHLGIVDFLQDWTFNKRVERLFKIYVLRKDPVGLSVMEPVSYMKRFQTKMNQILDDSTESGAVSPVMKPSLSSKVQNSNSQPESHSNENEKRVVYKNYAYDKLDQDAVNPMQSGGNQHDGHDYNEFDEDL